MKARLAISASLASILVLAAASNAAASVTVTFDSLTSASQRTDYPSGVYVEQGYQFAAGELSSWGTSAPQNADPDGATLFGSFDGTNVTVSKVGGGPFTLTSIDVGDANNFGWAGAIPIDYTTAGGTTTTSLVLDSIVGLQTFVTNRTDLLSFTLHQQNPYFQIDNVVFGSDAVVDPVAAVPEPEAWALMLAGFAFAGAAIRRQRRISFVH